MSNPIKALRGQVRQIVKDILPEIIIQELRSEMYKHIAKELSSKLSSIHSEVTESLKQMNDRSKDVNNMLMREVQAVAKAQAESSEKKEG